MNTDDNSDDSVDDSIEQWLDALSEEERESLIRGYPKKYQHELEHNPDRWKEFFYFSQDSIRENLFKDELRDQIEDSLKLSRN